MKRLFMDIETSPNVGLFWKASRKVWIPHENIAQEKAIICICWKWEGHRRTFSLTWDNGDDRIMVEKFMPIANEADEIVAHNGAGFDIKWFNTQCLQHGFEGLPGIKVVDTLSMARKQFYLNSNRLDYLGRLLFGKGKKPMPFDTWKAITLDHDPGALKEMVEYCKEDVRLLERVYHELARFSPPKTHVGVLDGKPKWTCAYCGSEDTSRSKRRVTAKGTVQHQMKCKECARYYTISDTAYKSKP